MKILFFILTLIITSVSAKAEWKKIAKDEVYGDYFYINDKKITKQSGFTFWWQIADFGTKPGVDESLSNVVYYQGDCKQKKAKSLIFLAHKLNMGKGQGIVKKLPSSYSGWFDAKPGMSLEVIMKYVCNQ